MSQSVDRVVSAMRQEGLNGAWMRPDIYRKQKLLAAQILREHPVDVDEVVRIIRHGTDVWPFNEGPWDLHKLIRHWEKAQASANDAQTFDPTQRDLRSRFKEEGNE